MKMNFDEIAESILNKQVTAEVDEIPEDSLSNLSPEVKSLCEALNINENVTVDAYTIAPMIPGWNDKTVRQHAKNKNSPLHEARVQHSEKNRSIRLNAQMAFEFVFRVQSALKDKQSKIYFS